MMLVGSLAIIDSHTIYKRTWYSKIKVRCAALGLGIMSAVGMSILNPTNVIKTKMEALSFVVSFVVVGSMTYAVGTRMIENCYYPKPPHISDVTAQSSSVTLPPSPDTTLCHLE